MNETTHDSNGFDWEDVGKNQICKLRELFLVLHPLNHPFGNIFVNKKNDENNKQIKC